MTREINTQELFNKYQQGIGVSELANSFNCGENTIRRRLRKLGISTSTERLSTKSKEWFIEKYIYQKWSANKIARELKCSKRPILDRLQKYGIIRDGSQAAKIRMADPAERKKISGSNHYNWQNGRTKINLAIRNSYEYKVWRKEVFERDDYTCQICGKKGGYLHADHIKQFALIVKENEIFNLDEAKACEELWDTENGRTLCKPCHKQTDTYGMRIV